MQMKQEKEEVIKKLEDEEKSKLFIISQIPNVFVERRWNSELKIVDCEVVFARFDYPHYHWRHDRDY